MRLPSVAESREIFSPSSAPEWLNTSSNAASRVDSMSFMASPRVATVSTNCSTLSRSVSVTVALRDVSVSVMRSPVSSSFLATSPPRRLRSRMSDSPEALSVELTSSARIAMVSASWLDVSMMASLSSWARPETRSATSWERPIIRSTIASDFSEKPSVNSFEPRRHHVFESGHDLGEILADVIGLEVQIRGELVARHGNRARCLFARRGNRAR